jgi:hypothetical protein
MNMKWLKIAIVAGTVVGFVGGSVATASAQRWPNQCYGDPDKTDCPICGGTCLGGTYLCCNNSAEME